MSEITPDDVEVAPLPSKIAIGASSATLEDGTSVQWLTLRVSDATGVRFIFQSPEVAIKIAKRIIEIATKLLTGKPKPQPKLQVVEGAAARQIVSAVKEKAS